LKIEALMVRCALCGFEFDEQAMLCHSQCPLADGCAILCCPNCGYQFVDESKSSLAGWLRGLLARRKPGAAPRPGAASRPPAGAVGMSLTGLQPGQTAEVLEIASNDPSRLVRLSVLGVAPGSAVTLEQRFPAYLIRVGETQLSLDSEVAQEIRVRPLAEPAAADNLR
jgi:ferrous iron transport protein A